MSKKSRTIPEMRALRLLDQILEMDLKDRDALPGQVVSKVKEAKVILKKRLFSKAAGG